MKTRTAALLLTPAVLLIAFLLVAPVAYLISFSLLAGEGPDLTGGVTLDHYAKLGSDSFYLRLFLRTLWLSALSTTIAAVIGYLMAHFMWRADPRWRGLLTVLVLSPLLVSIVVSSYGWMVILGKSGVINAALRGLGLVGEPLAMMHTDGAIVVGLVHIAIPFMVLSILAVLERIDRLLPEAAATLGAPPWRVTCHVILPLALPGIGAGTMIVFCLNLSAYVTPALLGGSGPNFITTLIYNQFVTLFDWGFGATLAAMLLVLCTAVVLLYVRAIAHLLDPTRVRS